MANKQTSDRLSEKAAKVMAKSDPFEDNEAMADLIEKIVADPAGQGARDAVHAHFDQWIKDARSLAGSVLSQDETKGERKLGKSPALAAPYQPSAGTSAYEMVAATEQRNVEVTETLIHMVAATVLSIVLDNGVGGPFATKEGTWTVAFCPADMDRMHREYEMSAKRDGLMTEISLQPREAGPLPPREAHLEDRPESLMRQDEPETPFEAQAVEHTYDRPLWAARVGGKLFPASNQKSADNIVLRAPFTEAASVENRFCYHADCPAERCNHIDTPEVTSGD